MGDINYFRSESSHIFMAEQVEYMTALTSLSDFFIAQGRKGTGAVTARHVYDDIADGLSAKEIRKKRGIKTKAYAKAVSAICSADPDFFAEKCTRGRVAGQKMRHVIWIDECVTDKLGGFILAQFEMTSRHILFLDRQGKPDYENYYDAAEQGVSAILTFDVRDKVDDDLATLVKSDVVSVMRDSTISYPESMQILRSRPKIIQLTLKDKKVRTLYDALKKIDKDELREFLENPNGPFIHATPAGLMKLPHLSYDQIARDGICEIHKGDVNAAIREEAEIWVDRYMMRNHNFFADKYAHLLGKPEAYQNALDWERNMAFRDRLGALRDMEVEERKSVQYREAMGRKPKVPDVA